LEVAQSEGLRRLAENEDSLEIAVRAEVWRSLEPVRQIPQLLAAAGAMPGLAGNTEPQMSEESIKSIVSNEITAATRQLISEQRELLEELAGAPATIAAGQWNQLGKKLTKLDEAISNVKERQEEASVVSLPALTAAATLEKELKAMQTQLETLSSVVKAALEQQQQQQEGTSGDAIQGTLEAALMQMRDEIRAAIESSSNSNLGGPNDQGGFDHEPAWLRDIDVRIEKALRPVMLAIADLRLERTKTLNNNNEARGKGSVEDAIGDFATSLEEAPSGVATVSARFEALEGRVTQLQRLEEEKEDVASIGEYPLEPPAVPQLDEEAADMEDKKEAYTRMQALLESANDSQDKGTISGKQENLGADGSVTISQWLSSSEEEDNLGRASKYMGRGQETHDPVPVAESSPVTDSSSSAAAAGLGSGIGNGARTTRGELFFESYAPDSNSRYGGEEHEESEHTTGILGSEYDDAQGPSPGEEQRRVDHKEGNVDESVDESESESSLHSLLTRVKMLSSCIVAD